MRVMSRIDINIKERFKDNYCVSPQRGLPPLFSYLKMRRFVFRGVNVTEKSQYIITKVKSGRLSPVAANLQKKGGECEQIYY